MKTDNVLATRPHKVIYRDGDKVWKVFDANYPKTDVLNEALNQARVEETGLPIPRVHGVTVNEEGKWAIISDYIEGETLAEKMEKDPENVGKYMKEFVEIQLEIHDKTAPLLNKMKDKMSVRINSLKAVNATTRYELSTRLESMPKHKKVLHGDYNPTNVVISPDGESWSVLDWAHVTQGNASADAARTYLLFWLSGDINSAEKYLDLFCKKSDTAKQYVQKWLPIVAASQSVKGKPEEKEFLMSWVNVVEYE